MRKYWLCDPGYGDSAAMVPDEPGDEVTHSQEHRYYLASDVDARIEATERELAEAKLTEAVLRSSIYNRDDDCACIPEDCSVTEYVAFLRSQAERLAGALKRMMETHPFITTVAYQPEAKEAQEALAAWKEGRA